MNEQKYVECVSNLRNMKEISDKANELVEILYAYNEDHKAIAKINFKAYGLNIDEILLNSKEMNKVIKTLLEICIKEFDDLGIRNDENISNELNEIVDRFNKIKRIAE